MLPFFAEVYFIQKETVREVLIEKYTLLLKGSIKYDRIKDVLFYQKRLKFLKGIYV